MRIRFVGGPCHNQLIDRTGHLESGDQLLILSDWYHLKLFRTARGTKYLQYVHESLIGQNGKPHPCTYKERFPKWRLCLEVR